MRVETDVSLYPSSLSLIVRVRSSRLSNSTASSAYTRDRRVSKLCRGADASPSPTLWMNRYQYKLWLYNMQSIVNKSLWIKNGNISYCDDLWINRRHRYPQSSHDHLRDDIISEDDFITIHFIHAAWCSIFSMNRMHNRWWFEKAFMWNRREEDERTRGRDDERKMRSSDNAHILNRQFHLT